MLPHTHRFPSNAVISVAVSEMAVVLCRAWSEKSTESIGRISYYLNNC